LIPLGRRRVKGGHLEEKCENDLKTIPFMQITLVPADPHVHPSPRPRYALYRCVSNFCISIT